MTSVSKIKSHRLDVPQQNNFNKEEVLDEQQLLNLERNFIVVQVEANCSQIKEEQDDVCISQEGEQFGLKQEPQTSDEDVPQQDDFHQEEVLDEQKLLDQERNFIVVQVEADCSQIKEEQEDICISQEGEQFGLKQETQTFEATSAGFGSDSQVATICPSSPQRKQYHGLGLVLGRLDEGSTSAYSYATQLQENFRQRHQTTC
ncbi:uncharacterized protein KZ484_011011 [Pholidichthys leucotaenia]